MIVPGPAQQMHYTSVDPLRCVAAEMARSMTGCGITLEVAAGQRRGATMRPSAATRRRAHRRRCGRRSHRAAVRPGAAPFASESQPLGHRPAADIADRAPDLDAVQLQVTERVADDGAAARRDEPTALLSGVDPVAKRRVSVATIDIGLIDDTDEASAMEHCEVTSVVLRRAEARRLDEFTHAANAGRARQPGQPDVQITAIGVDDLKHLAGVLDGERHQDQIVGNA